MNDVLQALSLARKARALAAGADATLEALRKGAPLGLVSADASERTERAVRNAARGAVIKLKYTGEQIGLVLGRGFAAAAVTDINLAKLITEKCTATEDKEC